MDEIEKKFSKPVSSSDHEPHLDCTVVVKNVLTMSDESDNPEITRQAVNKVIRDGLKLTDIHVSKAERKKSRDDNSPGLIIATLGNSSQKTKLMPVKTELRNTADFKNVYFNCALSQQELSYRSNIQTLIHGWVLNRNSIFMSNG
ncbi:hypothetical protein SNE40_002800 [Patella caerulea]|uniref:Uncharacterized protein n=1 Tax=Patella caerulea TaxID=87958 RepID=A0AAN8K995_PATCE